MVFWRYQVESVGVCRHETWSCSSRLAISARLIDHQYDMMNCVSRLYPASSTSGRVRLSFSFGLDWYSFCFDCFWSWSLVSQNLNCLKIVESAEATPHSQTASVYTPTPARTSWTNNWENQGGQMFLSSLFHRHLRPRFKTPVYIHWLIL